MRRRIRAGLGPRRRASEAVRRTNAVTGEGGPRGEGGGGALSRPLPVAASAAWRRAERPAAAAQSRQSAGAADARTSSKNLGPGCLTQGGGAEALVQGFHCPAQRRGRRLSGPPGIKDCRLDKCKARSANTNPTRTRIVTGDADTKSAGQPGALGRWRGGGAAKPGRAAGLPPPARAAFAAAVRRCTVAAGCGSEAARPHSTPPGSPARASPGSPSTPTLAAPLGPPPADLQQARSLGPARAPSGGPGRRAQQRR